MKINYIKKENLYIVKCIRFRTTLVECNKEDEENDIDKWELMWEEDKKMNNSKPLLLDYNTAKKIVNDYNNKLKSTDFIMIINTTQQ